MYTDSRSKRILLVAHCILNQNSISDGTADFPGTFKELVNVLLDSDVGILQMPCPELICLGLDRGDVHGAERPVVVENTRIRNLLKKPSTLRTLRKLVNQIIYQAQEYHKNGFAILGIVGVNRSPSCGVDTTSINNELTEGKGLFIEALQKKLENKKIRVELVGVKSSEIEKSVIKTKNLLNRKT